MTYAQPLIYGLTAWWRAIESVALVFGFTLTARACRREWAWI